MKTLATLFLMVLCTLKLAAQTDAENLIKQGVALYDSGKFEEAIAKYKQSYAIDSNSAVLFSEMSMTYLQLQDYATAESLCKRAFDHFAGASALKYIYDTYASCLDEQGKTQEALAAYNKGISLYPGFFELYFNKAITLYNLKKPYEARTNFQMALKLNPDNTSSYLYLGFIEDGFGNRIPAIVCYSAYLLRRPEGEKAKKLLPYFITKVDSLYYYVKTGSSTATMSSAGPRSDTTAYDYGTVESAMTLYYAMAAIEPEKDKEVLDHFKTNLTLLMELLANERKDHSNFYLDNLVPVFADMDKDKKIDGYIYYINSFENTDPTVQKLVKKHQREIDSFLKWYKNYR
jgi:tetratricopeptide (TPR) repeat protein